VGFCDNVLTDLIGNFVAEPCGRYFMEQKMTSGETKRQEMTSGDVLVCWIPLLICFESTGCEKRGGIAESKESVADR